MSRGALLLFVLWLVPVTAVADETWTDLLQGSLSDHWQGYSSDSIPPGWSLENGVLAFSDGEGDLVTRAQYENFELTLEWKISEGGNSGIFYLARRTGNPIYHSAPEMQILDDDRHPDGASPLTSAGSNYALQAAPRGIVKPVGEWNEVLIRVRAGHVQHWLNGTQTADYVLGSAEWTQLVAESKFSQWPEYGTARSGFIGLQDHGDPVWFRHIKIRRLD